MSIFHSKLTITDVTLARRAVYGSLPVTAVTARIVVKTLAAVGAVKVVLIDHENIPNSRWRVVSVSYIPRYQEGLLV